MKLKDYLKREKINISDLSRLTGISYMTLSDLYKISKAVNVSMEELIEDYLIEEKAGFTIPGALIELIKEIQKYAVDDPYGFRIEAVDNLENFSKNYCLDGIISWEQRSELLEKFVYAAYEQLKQVGADYLRKQIHEDWAVFERKEKQEEMQERQMVQEVCEEVAALGKGNIQKELEVKTQNVAKKSLWSFWEGRSKKKREKEDYREKLRQRLAGMEQFAVCEDTIYERTVIPGMKKMFQEDTGAQVYADACMEEEYGKTIYIEESAVKEEPALYKTDGELAAKLDTLPFVIGKKKENVNLSINDYSVSRVHARITQEEGIYYIEDLNSTNGTFKNGLRLQPYEKRRLEKGDELKFGKTEYVYR